MATAIQSQTSKPLRLFKLDPAKLEVGTPIPASIYTPDGTVLVRAGRVLKANAFDLLGDRLEAGLFGETDWPQQFFVTPLVERRVALKPPQDRLRDEASQEPLAESIEAVKTLDLVPLSIDALQVGKRLAFDVHNSADDILLRSGEVVRHSFVAQLRQAGTLQVRVPKSAIGGRTVYESAAARHRVARELDEVVQSLTQSEMTLGRTLRERRDLPQDRLLEETQRGLELHRQSLDKVAEFTEDLYRGRLNTVSPATDVVAKFLDLVNLDSSLLPVVAAFKKTPGDFLFQHALNVSLLSMAVAAQLSVRRENLLQIGVGALLQDVGMLKIPDEIRLAPRALTPREREVVALHPLHSLDIIRDLDGVGRLSLLICYQSHERAGGGGYPRRRRSELTHPYARLVGAANAYTAMSSDRPHRAAMSPYEAMETMLREASVDRFDRSVVRTVLDCIALFPLGSLVKLSDGSIAKILRANPALHTKPVIVRVDAQGQIASDEIDLSEQDDVYVIQALASMPEPSEEDISCVA